ncbi:hypothetical protein AgCh_014776 [Apium graveolens]
MSSSTVKHFRHPKHLLVLKENDVIGDDTRVLHHEGHKYHTLTLMKKEALFSCDACSEEAKDSSYVSTKSVNFGFTRHMPFHHLLFSLLLITITLSILSTLFLTLMVTSTENVASAA